MGDTLGTEDGAKDGIGVGLPDGINVGAGEGTAEGIAVGTLVGMGVGATEGLLEGVNVGAAVAVHTRLMPVPAVVYPGLHAHVMEPVEDVDDPAEQGTHDAEPATGLYVFMVQLGQLSDVVEPIVYEPAEQTHPSAPLEDVLEVGQANSLTEFSFFFLNE